MKKLNCYVNISYAFRNNEVSKNGTNHDIKHVIQEWFRTASDRDGGRKRRMDRAQAQQDMAGIEMNVFEYIHLGTSKI